MIAKTYICDDCGKRGAFTSYVKARNAGWAVAKDYSNCYCPSCAPAHRNGGAKKANEKLPQGWEQLGIEGI